MLERASACLDSGVRISLRATRRANKTQSRRLLHHTFWHHAAGDLHLPPCALPSACPPTDSSTYFSNHHHVGTIHNPQHPLDAPFLDFLYPAHTLAFMSRVSTTHLDRIWDRRNAHRHPLARSRGYSSMTASPSPSSVSGQTDPGYLPLDDLQPPDTTQSLHLLDPKQRLIHLLSSHDPVSPSEYTVSSTWSTFSQLDDLARRDVHLQKQLLLWMSHRSHQSAQTHVIDLYTQLPLATRTADIHHAAVAANLKLGRINDAADLHTDASSLHLPGPIGSNLLMEHAIEQGNWLIAKRVQDCFDNNLQNWPDSVPVPKLWNRMHRIPNLDHRLNDLVNLFKLTHDTEERKWIQRLIQPLWRVFVFLSIRRRSVSAYKGATPLAGPIRRLSYSMSQANIKSTAIYEDCIIQLCSDNTKLVTTVVNPIIKFVYNLYRRSGCFEPSPTLLSHMTNLWRRHTLAFAWSSKVDDAVSLEKITNDWKRHHKRIDDDALEIIMDCFARLGRVELVKSYADYYKSLHAEGLANASRLWPLIYVHAERADSVQASCEFDRIKPDFGVDPDLKCWNVLLHAYQKSNDLEGASSALDKLLATTLKPDAFTFTPLLEMYAKRGDVEAVDAVLALAKECGVDKLPMHMLNSRVLCHVNNEDIEGAESALEDAVKAVQSGQTKGPLTMCFNTVLTVHALRRDLDAAMRTYQRMSREEVALDANTYAALIQALCMFRQTPAAHKILRKVMWDNRVRPTALHYAIVMAGYVHQEQYGEALRVEQEMQDARIRPTISSQTVALKAKALLEHSRHENAQSTNENNALPLEDAIRDFEQLMQHDHDVLPIGSQEGFGIRHGSSVPALTADFLIFIHGKKRAFEAVSRMLQIYQEKASEEDSTKQMPLHLLTSIMSVHLRAGEYAEVDQYWALAKSHAQDICLQQQTIPSKRSSQDLSKSKPPSQIPPAYRFLLSRPLRYYIASQFSQSSPATIAVEVSELLSKGYALDNRTWNAYIVHLCRTSPPRALLAYSLVERFMIADWPGWVNARTGVIFNDTIKPKPSARAERLEYIQARYLRPGQLLPQYQTMVYLASALLEVRSFEAAGYGDVTKGSSGEEDRQIKSQIGSVKAIKEKAPRTLSAVQDMPRVYDHLQHRLIRSD